jgi:predicted ATPase
MGSIMRGWSLAEQRQEEGITEIRQGLAAFQATGAKIHRPYWVGLLAELYGKSGQAEEGLKALHEALVTADKTGECFYDAELYRLKGELVLQKSGVRSPASEVQENQKSKSKSQKSQITAPRSLTSDPRGEAEACFLRAIDIACKQQAKSLELRSVISLARLWQQQGKRDEAQQMLADVYSWFTEGFDTKDLQEAKALLSELAASPVRTQEGA